MRAKCSEGEFMEAYLEYIFFHFVTTLLFSLTFFLTLYKGNICITSVILPLE